MKILIVILGLAIASPSYASKPLSTTKVEIGKDKRKKAARAAKKQRKHIAKYGKRKPCKNAKRFRK